MSELLGIFASRRRLCFYDVPTQRLLLSQIDDFSMVAFQPLNIHDEDSLERILLQVDIALQYGEDAEPKDPLDGGENEEGEDEGADYDVGEGTTVEQSWREMLSGDGA